MNKAVWAGAALALVAVVGAAVHFGLGGEAEDAGAWRYTQETEARTGDIIAAAAYTETPEGRLTVGCREEAMRLTLDFGTLPANKDLPIEYRVDEGPVGAMSGYYFGDDPTIVIQSPTNNARRLSGKSIAFASPGFPVNPVRFPLEGAPRALSKVFGACGVPLTLPKEVGPDVVKGVDDWPPTYTVIAKKVLNRERLLSERLDGTKPRQLYLAVQKLKQPFLEHCGKNGLSDEDCNAFTMEGAYSPREMIRHYASPKVRREMARFRYGG